MVFLSKKKVRCNPTPCRSCFVFYLNNTRCKDKNIIKTHRSSVTIYFMLFLQCVNILFLHPVQQKTVPELCSHMRFSICNRFSFCHVIHCFYLLSHMVGAVCPYFPFRGASALTGNASCNAPLQHIGGAVPLLCTPVLRFMPKFWK